MERRASADERLGRRAGFTVVELLVVIVIIGILAAIIFLRLLSIRHRAHEVEVRATLRQLRHAVKWFEADVGAYPPSLIAVTAAGPPATGLHLAGHRVDTVTLSDAQKKGWGGPYLETTDNKLPMNMLSGGNQEGEDWLYIDDDPAEVGNVRIQVPGLDTTGVPYTVW